MPEVPLRIPQIGEGLQEARLVAVLKRPGDTVRRDEVIYQMETDKAVMDVESPYAGKVVRWLAEVDAVLPIGAEVLLMDTAEDVGDSPAPGHGSGAVATAAAPSPLGQREIPLRIPQIGEGLQEARLVAVLKQPGEAIKRDEVIYQMETDKAVMDVESPYAGTLVRWLAEVDTLLPIGAEVLVMATADEVSEGPSHGQGPVAAPAPARVASPAIAPTARRTDVPPRTRAYAKQKGLSEADLSRVPARGSKLMPEDVDAYLASGAAPAPSAAPATIGAKKRGANYTEAPMAAKQRVLASRLVRGNQLVVPGMMTVVADWGPIEALRAEVKAGGGDFQPSTFTMFAFAVAKATADHPIARSTIVGDYSVRTYDHIQLGIAVSLPGDELVVATVNDADTLTWRQFADLARANIEAARRGKDQATEATTLSITNMQAYGIREAMAVVVPPGVATIFLGEPYNGLAQDTPDLRVQRCCNIGITIDHRLINGVGGAEFLNAVRRNVESVRSLVGA